MCFSYVYVPCQTYSLTYDYTDLYLSKFVTIETILLKGEMPEI